MKARNTSFYYAFLVLPVEQRRGIIAVWDFCRAVDDAVDEGPMGGGAAREAVAFWREELARAFEGGAPRTREGRALQPFTGRLGLPRQAFEDVLNGVAMDLDRRRYETFEEVCEYCRHVASAVGLICIEVFGARDPRARAYAVDLGIALQLTNIVRDIKPDLARDRLYLPLEDLRRFECTEADLRRGEITEPVRRLLRFECDRARDYYARAQAARPNGEAARLVAAEIMRAVYGDLLTRIERAGYDVFSSRASVPRSRQVAIACAMWLTTRLHLNRAAL